MYGPEHCRRSGSRHTSATIENRMNLVPVSLFCFGMSFFFINFVALFVSVCVAEKRCTSTFIIVYNISRYTHTYD